MTRKLTFLIRGGKIPALCLAVGLCATTTLVHADQVINDDLIVTGEQCVGNNCVGDEVFSPINRSILKIKSTNTALQFDDASDPLGDFASTHWQISANEVVQFGRNQLAIEDLTAGTTPFIVAGDAPDNAVFVSSVGHVGLGTSLPLEDLHIVSPNSVATIRLEENFNETGAWHINAASGFFSIEDTVLGEIPVLIESGAPTTSIRVRQNGNIGMGTGLPDAPLHILRFDGTAGILVEDNGTSNGNLSMMQLTNRSGRARMQFTSVGNPSQTGDWSISSGLTFVLQERLNGQNVFVMDNAGNLAITGQLTTAGSCSVGCDRVFDADYDLPSIADHQAKMWDKGYLPNVGPTAEDAPFNISDKMGRMLNELEHAHIFIGQQQSQIEAQDNRIAALEAKLEALLSR
jgi:hypothetical protein